MNYEEMEHREAPKKSGVSYSSNPDDRYSKSEKVSKTTNQSQGKKKGEDIEEDQDKPKGTISTKITKNITIKNGKKTTIEKKIYTLQDGSTQIVENETIEEER